MNKIVILEDHAVFATGVQLIVEKSFPESDIVCLSTIDEFNSYYERFKIDLLILDLRLKNKSGIEILERISHRTKIKIIIVSSISSLAVIKSCIKFGVLGYLPKDSDLTEYNRCFKSVSENKFYLPDHIKAEILSSTSFESTNNSTISSKELTLINHLLNGNSPSESAESMKISIHSYRKIKASLFKKLGVDSTNELIQYALLHGIC